MTALVFDRMRIFETGDVARRLTPWMASVSAVLLVVALVAVAGFPTGQASADRLVRKGARLAAQAEVEGVKVLMTVDSGKLAAMVAYQGDKGWLGVDLEPVPADTVAAWAATDGDGPVPALSAVYGRASGVQVQVLWADGAIDVVATARDGSYVMARPGRVGVDRLVVVDDAGRLVLKIDDL